MTIQHLREDICKITESIKMVNHAHFNIDSNSNQVIIKYISSWDALTYQTGTAFPTEISWNPSPRIPSNLAAKNVILGSLVASIKS